MLKVALTPLQHSNLLTYMFVCCAKCRVGPTGVDVRRRRAAVAEDNAFSTRFKHVRATSVTRSLDQSRTYALYVNFTQRPFFHDNLGQPAPQSK